MKLLIILAVVAAARAGVNKRSCGNLYDEHILKTDLDSPFQLAVDYITDTLFFNYDVGADEYKSVGLNLTTNEIRDVNGISNGFSHAIDSDKHLLYVGTKDGIYVYNFDTEQSQFHGAKGQFVWTLFFKDDVLYYSEYPSQNFYTYSNGKQERFSDLDYTKVQFFVLDKDNDIFFSNDTGLYKQKKGTKDAVLYKTFDEWDIRALTLDAEGNVYAGIKDGIYSVIRNEVRMDKVVSVDDLYSLSFDSENNKIYSNSTTLVRLIRNNDIC